MNVTDQLTGLVFDDYCENDDSDYTKTHWASVCEDCSSLTPPNPLVEDPGWNFVCGVKGCSNESAYYYDFNPISKETI